MKKNKTSKKQSSIISDSDTLYASSITPQVAPSEKENLSSSNMETEESPTSSPVHLQDNSLPSRLKRKEEKSPMTSTPFSRQSSSIKESPLSHGQLTMWLRRLKTLPKALLLLVSLPLAKLLLKWRNRVPKILVHPDPRLKRIAKPVDFNKMNLKKRTSLVRKMGATLSSQVYGGRLGLAAPQIGVNLRVVIVRGNVMFNPEWTPTKAPAETSTEGCYSVPHKVYKVTRAPYGWAKWTNIDGFPMEDKLKGIPAIVFQHELDHLNGVCCADIGEEIITS